MSKRRRKLSVKKTVRNVLVLIIITVLLLNMNNIVNVFRSKITGYDIDTIEVFNELNIYNDVKKYEHSDTLERIVKTEYYNGKYLNEYVNIEFHDDGTFLSNINSLLGMGYKASEINTIYDKLSLDGINSVLDNDYYNDIVNVLNLKYFNRDNIDRYLILSTKNKELSYEDLVTYVNIGLDKEYYTDVVNVSKKDDILVIVNKYHFLGKDYVPSDLVAIDKKYNRGNNNLLRKEAKEAFEKMCKAALDDKITIYSGSAYRSYSYQQNLYNRYVASDGFKKAETFSARAGYSEHQTGLATDILNSKLDYISASDKEYDWLINNSYKFGFILRYPKDKEEITGYMYEEWHFRYVGVDVADEVYKSKLTYDEYVARNF